MKGRKQVNEGFLSLAIIETRIVYVCHSEGVGKTKYLSAFEQGLVAGDRRTGLCQELQHRWVFHTQIVVYGVGLVGGAIFFLSPTF